MKKRKRWERESEEKKQNEKARQKTHKEAEKRACKELRIQYKNEDSEETLKNIKKDREKVKARVYSNL